MHATAQRLSRALLAFAAATMLLSASASAAPDGNSDTDQTFTIAVIPDTQNYIDYTHQTAEGWAFDASKLFLDQMQYIAENTRTQGGDIAFVTSLGDVWQHQTLAIDPEHERRGFKRAPNPFMDAHFAPTPKTRTIEMAMARRGFEMISGKVPFSVSAGNHDHDAMWTDASHPPAKDPKGTADMGLLHAGGLTNFNSVFGADTPFFSGKDWYVGSFNGGADSAQIFTAGGYRFLHISLQFDAPTAALKWAEGIVKRYPGLPTIISTHDYLDTEGRRLANPIIDNSVIDPEDNSPQMMWDKFISRNDQIFLVVCGHEHAQARRVDDNVNGHKVYQLLSDYQGRRQTAKDAGVAKGMVDGIGDGWMRFMTFDMTSPVPKVRVRTYSTYYKAHSSDIAQYAAWYKPDEHPALSDAEYRDGDEFTLELTDFRARFDVGGKAR